MRRLTLVLATALAICPALYAQTPTAPNAAVQSNAERAAVGYLKTLVNAQKVYKSKRGAYATSLQALVGSGSFTRRMASTDRGEYRVAFRGTATGYSASLIPTAFDAEHRSFFVDQTGKVRVDAEKPASGESEVLK